MKADERLLLAKGLPQNVEVEKLVLGSVLLNDANFIQVAERLKPDDFALEIHKRLFLRMSEMYERSERIDRVTLANELNAKGQLESIGGLTYLVSLDEGMPEIANIDSYIRIVKDKSTLRKLMFIAQRVSNDCVLGVDGPEEIISAMEQSLRDLGDKADDEGMVSTAAMMENPGLDNLLAPRQLGAISLPIGKLNEVLGGLHGGQMVVLMARTSRGKSSFAYQIATAAAMQQASPVIWTLEMSPREAFQCIVQQISGVWHAKYQLTLEERHSLQLAAFQLQENWIYFDERARSVSQFVARLRRVQQKESVGMAIVDHLQLIRSANSRNRVQEVSENSRALKLAAKDLDIPILVLSQVDRASVKGDGKIGLHSAKESGDIENDADVVMWIDSDEEFSWEHDTLATLCIGKNRTGGRAGLRIPLLFRPRHRAFVEVLD